MQSISLVHIVYIFVLANAVIGIILHIYFDLRRDRIRIKLADPVSPYHLLMKEGGSWLTGARSWIQFHCHNGSDVTWGSGEELKPPFRVRQIEEIAA
jgi:hypothetical protein